MRTYYDVLKVMVGFRMRDTKRLKENATSCRDIGMSLVKGVCFPSRMVLLLGFCHRGGNVGSLMSDFQVSGLTYPVFENTTITKI